MVETKYRSKFAKTSSYDANFSIGHKCTACFKLKAIKFLGEIVLKMETYQGCEDKVTTCYRLDGFNVLIMISLFLKL